MTGADVLVIALTWLGVGIVMTALTFNVSVDREKKQLFKDTKELLKRNEELIEQNRRLTSYNNEVNMRISEIHNDIEYMTQFFKD